MNVSGGTCRFCRLTCPNARPPPVKRGLRGTIVAALSALWLQRSCCMINMTSEEKVSPNPMCWPEMPVSIWIAKLQCEGL
jgi:hypothetical protein